MRKYGPKFRYIFPSVVLLVFLAQCAEAATLYVSPKGNDAWSGRLAQPNTERADGPLATLGGARDRIRELRLIARIPEPIHVVIADGRYTLSEPFVLGP